MKILGIDPGYDRVGWAVIEVTNRNTPQVIACGCIQTSKKESVVSRYTQIISELRQLCSNHTLEDVSMESIFFSKNQKTAMRVSEARGVIIGALLPYCNSLVEYTPNQVKLAVTGYGTADKQAVEKMVRMQLKITDPSIIDDTIDAIAIAFTHALLKDKNK